MVQMGKRRENLCSIPVSVSYYSDSTKTHDLHSTQNTEERSGRVVEVVLPLIQRLEIVHETPVEAISRRYDDTVRAIFA